MNNERVKEMSRFVVVGILATAIHYVVYYVLLPYMSHNVAFTVGYVVSFLCNYGLSSRFTFRVGTSVQRFVSFGLSHATNYFIQMVLLNLFIGLGVSEPLAPLPVYVLAVPINYLTVRFALTRRSTEHDGYYLFLMAAGFAMLWLNLMDVPTLSDDMIYRFVWHADESAPVEPVNNVGDLLRSQWSHYMLTNGRMVAHTLIQAFLAFTPPIVLQVLNTLFFVLLIHLTTSWVASGRREGQGLTMDATEVRSGQLRRLLAAVAACFLLFIVFQGFRTAMLWGLGALNYLWPLVAVMSLLLWLRRVDGQRLSVTHVLLSPLALLAGWSHEALSLPVSVVFVAWLVFSSRKRPEGKAVGAVAMYMLWFLVGTALCVLSPGIWGRAAEGISLQSRLLSGAVSCVSNVRVTWILAVTLVILWWRGRRNPTENRRERWLRQHVRSNVYGYLALVMAMGIVLLCGTNLERVAFFADFIAMLLLLPLLIESVGEVWARRLVVVACVIMLMVYVPAYLVRKENSENWRLAELQMKEPGRELIAVRQPTKGENPLMDYFREHYVNSSFVFGFYSSYMGFDSEDINMRCAATLFGKSRLTFLPEDVVQRIKSDTAAYSHYELDRRGELYVWRMDDDRPVTAVTFMLKDEDPATLLPHQRLVAYKGSEYELDDFNFEVVSVEGKHYLVFTKPTTNIFRRIENIDIKH
jgi:putative flippase GtrA